MERTDFSDCYKNSNWFSKLTLFWTNGLVSYVKTHKKINENVKLVEMPAKWDTQYVTQYLEDKIKALKQSNPDIKVKNRIGRVIISSFKSDIIILLTFITLADVFSFLSIFLLSFFVGWIKDENAEMWPGYLYAILVGVINLLSSYFRDFYFFY